ncbi:uncharacterized protein BYT42DRAFT_92502 [Radiomyces spectabilis]|uniref:uncharacterized protein n=1 Tax=Radiomyces spectabilis TaxID=64574 RepID=UPI00221F161D|nr:uncharacterized protein BYT42DRAFT_92502 [Radiomyces spectabilis]KAI8370545.1 hypothetical protein BYT42DRAFT_92502 [Radiomyces spectabilis]
MSYPDDYSRRDPLPSNAADLANSFLNSVSDELNHAGSYEQDSRSRYHDDYYKGGESRRHHRGERYRDSRDRDRDRGRSRRDRSRDRHDRYDRSSRDRHHYSSRSGRDDRDRRSSRRRSPSRRSPSPRFGRHSGREEDVVPLHLRERKLDNWDKAPPGMEMMSAAQAKQTGLFPLPGQVVGTRTPQSFQSPSQFAMWPDQGHVRTTQGAAGPVAQNALLARQAKRVYVGQIPLDVTEKPLHDFFNATMTQMNLAEAPPVTSVQINHEKNFAFVEFQTPEQATAAMSLDGIMFEGHSLKVRRPKDYVPPTGYDSGSYPPGMVSMMVPDTPNKIFVGGLPSYLNQEQVMELLTSFGELRAFNLVTDSSGQSKGFAFCEYADPSVTDLACQGLNNMELGDRKLVVQRASVGAKHGVMAGGAAAPMGISLDFAPIMSGVTEEDATRVLQLMNMVMPDELENDEDYQEIWEDVAEECSKFGSIVDMKIPRPTKTNDVVPGLGKIFVRFQTKEETMAALQALAGRKFADRTVVTSFVEEDNYLADLF